MPLLDIREIRKSYGDVKAIDGVSFSVERGQMVGLLGPNGAGKTTTVSIIAGLLTPDSGQVLVDGKPLRGDTDPSKGRIGLVPQDLALFDEMTAEDNLTLFGSLYSLPRAQLRHNMHAALDLVGLADRRRSKVSTYSGGMKRRLNLAAALLHDPQILLLDEPTVGVDPQSRNAIFDNLESLKKQGKTLLYTTHYMEEAERLCDRVVIIDHGRVIADDTQQGLYRRLPATNMLIIELEDSAPSRLDGLLSLEGVRSVDIHEHLLRVGVSDLATIAGPVIGWLTSTGCRYHHLTSERASLETVFLTLTGRSLRDS